MRKSPRTCVPHPEGYPRTPDGRYFVVQGRLWRTSNPALDPAEREQLVRDLMAARRAVRASKGDPVTLAAARVQVDAAKRSLGERGPVWWVPPTTIGTWRRTPPMRRGSSRSVKSPHDMMTGSCRSPAPGGQQAVDMLDPPRPARIRRQAAAVQFGGNLPLRHPLPDQPHHLGQHSGAERRSFR
jgi:hypothetical protein